MTRKIKIKRGKQEKKTSDKLVYLQKLSSETNPLEINTRQSSQATP